MQDLSKRPSGAAGGSLSGNYPDPILASTAAPGSIVRAYTAGVVLRDAVYQKTDGSVGRANAGSLTTSPAIGLASLIDSPSPGFCEITYAGDLPGFSGLTPGKTYILAASAGQIVAEDDTLNPIYPSTLGSVIQEVGIAGSASTLFVGTNRDFEEL